MIRLTIPPEPVLRAARAAAAVSMNIYGSDPSAAISEVARISGRPVLVTEFSFRSQDAGLPNSKGAGPRVETQEQRAQSYRTYVEKIAALPEVVGFHWFQWADQPREGRWDGEDSNYGLVDIQDHPYPQLTQVVTEVNRRATQIHELAAPGRSVQPSRQSGRRSHAVIRKSSGRPSPSAMR